MAAWETYCSRNAEITQDGQVYFLSFNTTWKTTEEKFTWLPTWDRSKKLWISQCQRTFVCRIIGEWSGYSTLRVLEASFGAKTTKWSSERQNLTNLRSEPDWSWINHIRFGKHSSSTTKLLKVCRVLQVSGHWSPTWFFFQRSRQVMLKEVSRLFSGGLLFISCSLWSLQLTHWCRLRRRNSLLGQINCLVDLNALSSLWKGQWKLP